MDPLLSWSLFSLCLIFYRSYQAARVREQLDADRYIALSFPNVKGSTGGNKPVANTYTAGDDVPLGIKDSEVNGYHRGNKPEYDHEYVQEKLLKQKIIIIDIIAQALQTIRCIRVTLVTRGQKFSDAITRTDRRK